MVEYKIFTDGGARGNPGPSASAWVVLNGDSIVAQGTKFLGIGTNNYAEYMGVILALEWLTNNRASDFIKVSFFLDSELVVNQLNGKYKIKAPELIKLSLKIRELIKKVNTNITFTAVRRDKNKFADSLVNEALDSAKTQNTHLL